MTKLTDLSQPELDVMLQLAQSKTTSVVLLAADLWRVTPEWESFDPYPLLVYVLDGLSARGLCTFRISTVANDKVGSGRLDMPFDIRLSPKGWALMGYPNKTVEVGSRGRHERESNHPGDMTDYVNLAGQTYGGAIGTQTFAEHRRDYPHHRHTYGVPLTMANQATQPKSQRHRTEAALADPHILSDPNGTGNSRGYIRVTAELEATVLAARQALGATTYGDIANATGLPERTVRYVLTDLPRLRRTDNGEAATTLSLKERVMGAIEALGHIRDVPELRRITGMADTDHDLMHVLHSLHTQGRIDFTERGSGMGKATVVDIRLPKKGAKRVDRETYEALPEIVKDRLPEQLAPEPERIDANLDRMRDRLRDPERIIAIEQEKLATPEPEAESYPLLDDLLDRERKRQDGDSKGMAFVVAAEAIQDIDPDTARSLMDKAKQYDIPFPSPIEREYIRYVAAHPNSKET